jgi:hypothetical protein
MRSLKIAGLCLASTLVMGIALAGTANASPLWLVCLPKSGGNYVENQCRSLHDASGGWESEALAAGKFDTVRLTAFTLILKDTGAVAEVVCNGLSSEGWGILEGTNRSVIYVAKIKEPETHCEGKGLCVKVREVVGANLPWRTEITETENKFLTTFSKGPGGAGEPGWKVKCDTGGVEEEDVCLQPVGQREKAELINELTAGVLLVRNRFETSIKSNCTLGGKEKGAFEGLMAILLNAGTGLSINKE